MDAFHVQGRALDLEVDSYYSNITGFIHGDAIFNNITLPLTGLDEAISWRDETINLMTGVNTTNITDKLGSWHWHESTQVAISVLEKSPLGSSLSSSPSGPINLIHVRFIYESYYFLSLIFCHREELN